MCQCFYLLYHILSNLLLYKISFDVMLLILHDLLMYSLVMEIYAKTVWHEFLVIHSCIFHNIQSSAVITWSNIVRYYTNNYRNWGRISITCWIHKRHPTPRPYGRAMGCYLWEKWPVIMAPHCTYMQQMLFLHWIYIHIEFTYTNIPEILHV